MTVVEVLSPRGRGAIAVVAIEGAEAVSLVDRWFAAANKRSLAEQRIDRITFGRWLNNQNGEPDRTAPGEELIVVRTAATRVEVHCHGGEAASSAVVRALVASRATERTDAPPTTLRDQALAALRQAPTARSAGILLDQVNGAFEQAIREVLGAIDQGALLAATDRLDELLSSARLGLHLLAPWRVVLAGPPNVGKSSLINALVGYERAIVYDQPGTTRDVVTATTAIDGWPVTLADTAGLHETQDRLEGAGIELARQTLRRAEIVIVIDEATRYATKELATRLEPIRAEISLDATVIEVASKLDLAEVKLSDSVIGTSIPNGRGIEPLLAAITSAMDLDCPPAGTAIPFLPEHREYLRMAREAFRENRPSEASGALRSLLAAESTLAIR